MARKLIIKDEQPFQVDATSFCIGASSSGYTLNYSADGVTYTAWVEATQSGVNLPVVGVACGMYFKLVGNTDDAVVVTF